MDSQGHKLRHLAIQAASIKSINHKALIYYQTLPAGMVMLWLDYADLIVAILRKQRAFYYFSSNSENIHIFGGENHFFIHNFLALFWKNSLVFNIFLGAVKDNLPSSDWACLSCLYSVCKLKFFSTKSEGWVILIKHTFYRWLEQLRMCLKCYEPSLKSPTLPSPAQSIFSAALCRL